MSTSGRPESRAARDVFVLIAGVFTLASLSVGTTLAFYGHTFTDHTRWNSSKVELGMPVGSALAFITRQQAIARNRLDLGAWRGFQEVYHREPLDLASYSLRFRPAREAYLHVIYDRSPSGFSGVRLSDNPDLASLAFRALHSGEFVEVRSLPALDVSPDRWHTARVDFDGTGAEVSLDGRVIVTHDRVDAPQQVGVRGGLRSVVVDDLRLVGRDGTVIREGFSHWAATPRWALLAAAILAVPGVVAFFALRRVASLDVRTTAMWLALGGMVIVAVSAIAFAYQWIAGRDYRVLGEQDRRNEEYWIGTTAAEIDADLRARYADEPAPREYRILFLGSSQTWGAGAEEREGSWVRILERRLDAAVPTRRIVHINGAVSGHRSRHTLGFLERTLLGLRPDAAVVNLASNDEDADELAGNLERIIAILRGDSIEPVLLLEANAREAAPGENRLDALAEKHDAIRELGVRLSVPVLDMHSWLVSLRDRGILWWDFVHLTPYGHKAVAEYLERPLLALLMPDSVGALEADGALRETEPNGPGPMDVWLREGVGPPRD